MDIKILISFLTLIPFALCSWSRWSRWSPCTRTCGGGLSNRTRHCLGEESTCAEGESIRYRVCHLRACPRGTPDARQEQCSSYNTIPYGGHIYNWIPDKDASNPCVLRCKVQGQDLSVVLAPKVQDGTRCTRNSKAICIDGACVPVGCDNVVGSSKRRDACGVCGGDGSTCEQEEITRNSPDMLQILPSIRGSNNNNMATKTASGSNEENKMMPPTPKTVTDSHEDFDNPDHNHHRVLENMDDGIGDMVNAYEMDMDYMEDRVALDADFDYQNDRGSDAASFGDSIPAFLWQMSSFSPCSATCGEGTQRTTIFCMNVRTRKQVDDRHCPEHSKPYHRERVCDTNIPCREKARWNPGPWGSCSVTCGGGFQERPIYCVHYHANGDIIETEEEECEESLPDARKRCNEFSCPTWHTGQWSPCSVECGAGEQFRAVVCKRLTTEVTCDEEEKPAETQVCHTGVICIGNHGKRPIPEHDTRVVIDNKPIKVVPSHNDYKEYRQNNGQDYSEFRDNPNIEWRGGNNYNYRGYGDNYNEFDYRDYGYSDFEYNGNSIVESMGIGSDYDYRGNEMMASHDGSGETPVIHLDELRPQEPSFVAFDWSACSVTCGHGVRKRRVKCRVFISYTNTFQELPESRCMSTSPKPVDEEECIMANCPIRFQEQNRESFAWQFAGYEACSATCGGGMRNPLFYCVRQDVTEQIQMDEEFCSGFPRPSGVLQQSCNNFACPARWKVYPYGDCSNPCGGGNRQRQVDCILDTGPDGQTERVPDQMCAATGLAVPERSETCNNVSCPPEWVEGEFSQCTATCGRGVRTRQVLCKQVVPPLRQVKVIQDQFCRGDKPESNIQCEAPIQCMNRVRMNPDPSHYVQLQRGDRTLRLVAGGSAVLLPGIVVRIRCPVSGFDRSGLTWNQDGDTIGRKGRIRKTDRGVLQIRSFERRDEGVYYCEAGDKSTAITLQMHSDSEAIEKYIARGEQREQRFLQQFRQQSKQDRNRKEEFTEPYIFKYFETHQLPFHFFESEWGACSQTCGGGGVQSRVVTCELNFERYYLKAEDRHCLAKGEQKPLTTQDCGFEQCPHWEAGRWGDCSDDICMGPGTGAETRTLHCLTPDRRTLPHHMCGQSDKPEDRRPCDNQPACVANWIASDWSECSQTCGSGGYETRSLLCVWVPNGKPANGQCGGKPKPDVIRSCDKGPCETSSVCRDQFPYCNLVETNDLCKYDHYRTICCSTCTLLFNRYKFRH